MLPFEANYFFLELPTFQKEFVAQKTKQEVTNVIL